MTTIVSKMNDTVNLNQQMAKIIPSEPMTGTCG